MFYFKASSSLFYIGLTAGRFPIFRFSHENRKRYHQTFDFQGKEIDTIIDAEQSANKYEVKYRLKDPIAGLYFVIMQFDNTYFQVAKMLVQ